MIGHGPLKPTDPRHYYLGWDRQTWLGACYRVLFSSTTADGRYLLLRGGFLKFEHYARAAFKELAGFSWTSEDLRAMWSALERDVAAPKWVTRHGKMQRVASEKERLWKAFEKMYDEQKHHEPFRESPEPEYRSDGNIVVENYSGRVR